MSYSKRDLEEGWEFKIVRGSIGAFHSPAALQKLIDEEARGGWVLLEKFDDSRVRFKRPASAKSNDALLPRRANVFRTNLISPAQWLVLVVVIGVLVGLTVCALLGLSTG